MTGTNARLTATDDLRQRSGRSPQDPTGLQRAIPLTKRILGWGRRSGTEEATGHASCSALRRDQQQALYAEIGAFLFTHELDLTALNFGCAHDYLSRSDHELELAIEACLATPAGLTNAWVEAFFAEHPRAGICAEALSRNAEKLERELTQCVSLVEKSRGKADAYGTALQVHAENLAATDHASVVARLATLTRDMLEHTRRIRDDLEESAKQTRLLRTNLRRAKRAAEIDHLTGLPNRRGFEVRLREACDRARDVDGAVVVALCDIDHFKVINDAHGHDAGDRVLGLVARELRASGTARLHVARYGGEEFVMIFEGHDGPSAAAIVDRTRDALASRSLINQESGMPIGRVTFSAGIATVRRLDDPAATIRLADTALYVAKQTGRDRVCLVDGNGEIRRVDGAATSAACARNG